MRVLYVEDNEQDADLTCRLLKRRAPDIEVETAHTLGAARQRLAQAPAPDVLLVDVRLPDGNGLELLGEVRAQALPVAVVMLTGSGDEALVVTALRSGADDYVVKAGAYLDRLPDTLRAVVSGEDGAGAATPNAALPIRVLYAERSASDVDLLRRHLARYAPHIQLDPVSTAQEALARLPPLAPARHDVLLLDFHLPGMNAIEVVREVRQARGLELPILVITGHGNESSAVQALKLGATDYLVKHDDVLQRLPVAIENAWFRAQLERERGALRESEERFRQMAESIGDVFWLTDPSRHRVLYASPAYEQIWGDPVAEVYEDWEAWQRRIHPDDRARVRQTIAGLRREDYEIEFRIVRADGAVRHLLMRGYGVRGGAGQGVRRAGLVQDVTLRREQEARIEHLAYHDALTGLPNRLLVADRLQLALAHAQRLQHQVAVLYLDLDRFKVVNDSLGHLAGDALLREVARRLCAALREEDTVGRLGGDEFQVVLGDIVDAAAAAHVAEKLMQALAAPFLLEGHEVHVSASLGIALFPRDGASAELLLKYADTALYEAKAEGRNAYRFFSPEMNTLAHGRLRLENDLRRAIERGELVLHYQPQLDLATGRVDAVEALVRWQHPQRGLLQPGTFIPVAEETGLIVGLGEWVLSEACRQAAEWHATGLADLRVAVNISPRQLQRPGLDALVQQVLADTGLPPACLELEITESSMMVDPPQAIRLLQALHDLGVQLSIDDFGTGWSSFAHLRRMPLHRLKIDGSFVAGLAAGVDGAQAGDAGDTAIVQAIIVMTHQLGLRVIAEGVETLEQRMSLMRQGCDEMQGYLLAAPVPAPELPALLSRIGEQAPGR